MEEKKHIVVIKVGTTDTYICAVCQHTTKNEDEFKGECGGLPPLGFGVGDKAPSHDKFGG
jgi:hypothetical protein